MDKVIDLNNLYEKYMKNVVSKNPEKYQSIENLEKDIGMLVGKWENSKSKILNDMTPLQYVKNLAIKLQLFDYVEDCLESNIEVADVVCTELLLQPKVEEFLKHLILSNVCETYKFGAILLKEKGGEKAVDIFIELLTNPNIKDKIKNIAFEFLCEDEPTVVDKILAIINNVPINDQDILVEIMAEYKGKKDVFYWLVTMLYRAERVELYAKLLGQYGDVAAVDILKSFAQENEEINYVEYVEIRNAVERLGGEFKHEKDFSEDELYKFLHFESKEDDNNEQ